uniref:At2g35280-like TPR domain-containing protein n=1 Tax=Lactuca sativa TaxID=4236 RepID=A0A9R1V3S7_LACSA|nr:hypothetical protein LSAT_V11C700367810 [Lactuca sativa]
MVRGNSQIDAFKCQLVSCELFRDSVTSDAKYFTIGEEIAGKQLLQDAADQGQFDAIFVLGMMLMAEGIEQKKEALIMLENAYVNTRRSWNLRHTCNKVQNQLDECFVKFARMIDISSE